MILPRATHLAGLIPTPSPPSPLQKEASHFLGVDILASLDSEVIYVGKHVTKSLDHLDRDARRGAIQMASSLLASTLRSAQEQCTLTRQ